MKASGTTWESSKQGRMNVFAVKGNYGNVFFLKPKI